MKETSNEEESEAESQVEYMQTEAFAVSDNKVHFFISTKFNFFCSFPKISKFIKPHQLASNKNFFIEEIRQGSTAQEE